MRYRAASQSGKAVILDEFDIDDATAARLCSLSAATIDRRLVGERATLTLTVRSGTKPGSLLKSQIMSQAPCARRQWPGARVYVR